MVFRNEEEDRQEAAFWNWLFKENPEGEGLIYVLRDGDRVVGHYADVPKRFVVNGREVLGTFSLDMMVHPQYRGGMFFRLGLYAVRRTKESGYAFLTASVIRKWSIEGLRRVGWRGLFELPVLVYPLRFQGIVDRYLHFSPFSLLMGGIARFFYLLLTGMKKQERPEGVEVAEMASLDHRFDQFWDKARSLFPVMGVRDRVFFAWRYLRHPTRNYRIYRATKGGEMKGYIVLRRVSLLQFNSAVIVDLLALDPGVLLALVEKGIEQSRREGVDLIGCMLPRHHPYFEDLRRRGFLPTPKHFLFLIYPHSEDETILNPGSWYFNWGDTDVI